MRASSLSFRIAVLCAIAGMIMGIAMAASQNHSVMPAHAHLNLLGWVSLFLFGIYYKLHPAIDVGRLALLQVGVWTAGTVVVTIGVTMFYLGHQVGDPIAAVGSIIVLAAMILFAVLVFRPVPAERGAAAQVMPAE